MSMDFIARAIGKQNSSQLVNNIQRISNSEKHIPRGNISPKLIQNTLGTFFITTQRPNKNKYVRFRLKQGVVTTSGSVGGNAELLRCIEVVEVVESFVMKSVPSAEGGAGAVHGTSVINYTLPEGSQALTCSSITTRAVGAYKEYVVTTPKGKREIDILFYGTSGSSADTDISVDGVVVLDGISLVKATSAFFLVTVPLPTSGTHTIRATTNDVKYMTIAGVDVVQLSDFAKGHSYDAVVNIGNATANQYVDSNGSMDYALLDADTDLWCGSYHGGGNKKPCSLFARWS